MTLPEILRRSAVLVALLAPLAPAAPVPARPALPTVVEVPSRPAFLQPPKAQERPARAGQTFIENTILRTSKPGRMQVELADGRSFRLGGDAVLRFSGRSLDLEKGQIIGWIRPGSQRGTPMRIRTRLATASILGTTVFLDASESSLLIFSWEGHVEVTTEDGRRYQLHSGEQLSHDGKTWQAPRSLSPAERAERRRNSQLLNGFQSPMETLPVIERELGLSPTPAR
ncbi:MAG: FecR domain-containing protein [Cyanobacteriota bacterium]|jgi:hypothetical protein